jgi:hypothetical protein
VRIPDIMSTRMLSNGAAVASLVLVGLPGYVHGQTRLVAETRSVADGPWSGEIVCVLSTRGTNYQEDQTQRWRLTGERPEVKGATRFWPAVWSVQGGGTKGQESWTIDVSERAAPLAIYETVGPRGNNGLRIDSQHAQLNARDGIRVAPVPGVSRTVSVFPVWELGVPTITADSAATVTTISDSWTRPGPPSYAWQPASDATATETCKWRFTRTDSDLSRANSPTPVGGSGNTSVTTVIPIPVATGGFTQQTTTPASQTPAGQTTASAAPLNALPNFTPGGGTGTGGLNVDTSATAGAAACTMAAPSIQSSITPGVVSLSWPRLDNATLYKVSRRDRGDIQTVTQPTSATVTFQHRAPMNFGPAYDYTVTAQYANGCGRATVSLSAPHPGTPTIVDVAALVGSLPTLTGTVRLSWDFPAGDYSGFVVIGPGVENGKDVVVPPNTPRNGPFTGDVPGVRPGEHAWLVAPYWDTPEGRQSDVSRAARASGSFGFYRAVITGFTAVQQTEDSGQTHDLDGLADEVYVATSAWVNGSYAGRIKSKVYGDVIPHPLAIVGGMPIPAVTRVQAGTADFNSGGIRTGDQIGTLGEFPITIWAGWLGGSTSLVVSPTIWEWDGRTILYDRWESALSRRPEFNASSAEQASFRTAVNNLDLYVTDPGQLPSDQRPPIGGLSDDRPIALPSQSPTFMMTAQGLFPGRPLSEDARVPRTLVSGQGAPALPLDFISPGAPDRPNLQGRYQLFIRWEAISTTEATAPLSSGGTGSSNTGAPQATVVPIVPLAQFGTTQPPPQTSASNTALTGSTPVNTGVAPSTGGAGLTGTPTPHATAETAVDPANFKALQIADGTVRLTWDAVPGAGSYMLGGPGTNTGINVNGTSYTVTGVPSGEQTWTVATMYAPGGILTTGNNWPKARALVITLGVDTPTSEWVLGQQRRISWTHNLPAGVNGAFDVGVTLDGGATWTSLANARPGASMMWTVAPPVGARARVRVKMVFPPFETPLVAQSGEFAIVPPIQILSPSGGQYTTRGRIQIRMKGAFSPGQNYQLDFSGDGGATWKGMTTSVYLRPDSMGIATVNPFLGTSSYTLPTNTARLRVYVAGDPNSAGVSDLFTVVPVSLSVVTPSGWRVGQPGTVQWNHNLPVDTAFGIQISYDGGKTWASAGSNFKGSSATVNVSGPATYQTRVRVAFSGTSASSEDFVTSP